MSTVLSRQDIINIIYGATVLGAGGGGSASSGLEMLENYIKKHGDPKLRMISTGEMNVNAYAAVTAGMGSPVALKDIDFTPYAVNAYNALVDMAATMGRTLSYTIPVEIGGFNTFVPMLIAMMNDIPVIDADGAARAVPALDTLLLHVNGLDTSPLAMADHKNNRLTIELADPRDAHEAEVIGRNICVAFDIIVFTALGPIRATGMVIQDNALQKTGILRILRVAGRQLELQCAAGRDLDLGE